MDRPRRQARSITRWGVPVLVGLALAGLLAQRQAAPARPVKSNLSPAGAHPGSIRSAAYLGAHSELYLETPLRIKRALFAQAAAMGASQIRLDIELSAVFPGWANNLARHPLRTVGHLLLGLSAGGASALSPTQAPADWSGVDQYMSLARRYHLHVLADLTSTPNYMAHCPPHTPAPQWYRCPPRNPKEWGHEAGEIAAHTRGVIKQFEIINEPDTRWAFRGTPEQYAGILSASYRAIHAADPRALVLLGGLRHIGPWGRHWMNAVLTARGADARRSFDVANIHVRVPPRQAAGVVCGWRTYLASKGFRGPLWVTETGYPADPANQPDPGYQDGAPAQARWLADVIPTLLRAGAGKVFVTERDSGHGGFASEGVLRTQRRLGQPPSFRRRPSFYTVQRDADEGWNRMMSAYLGSRFGRTAGRSAGGPGC